MCGVRSPGHDLSPWTARLLARTPWAWAVGRVVAVGGHHLAVECPGVPGLTETGLVHLWHHRDLSDHLADGDPVRVHERHQALQTAGEVLSVRVAAGLGAPPDPVDLETWARGRGAEVVVLH